MDLTLLTGDSFNESYRTRRQHMTRRTLIDEFLLELDAACGMLIRHFLDSPEQNRETLRYETQKYLLRIQRSAAGSVNLERATVAADACLRLLADKWSYSTPEWHIVQAAVRYFLEEEDADSDLASLSGFDDDVAVMQAAERVLLGSELTDA